jgi:hypothetical protein
MFSPGNTSALRWNQVQVSDVRINWFFIALLLTNGIAPLVLPKGLVSAGVMGLELLLVPILLFLPLRIQIAGLLTFSFLGHDYPLILSAFLFLFVFLVKSASGNRMRLNTPAVILCIIILYALILFMINIPIFVSVPGLIFWLMTFGGPVFCYFYFLQFDYSAGDVRKLVDFLIRIIRLQFWVIMIQAVFNRSLVPGDWAGGTMNDAHDSGVYVSLYLLSLVLPALLEPGKRIPWLSFSFWGHLLVAFAFTILTDSKTLNALLLIALALLFIFMLLIRLIYACKHISKGKMIFGMMMVFLGAWIFPQVAQSYIRVILKDDTVNLGEMLYTYMLDPNSQINQKAKLYDRAFVQMQKDEPLLWWIGTGPGTFASRASNTLAYDVMYKEDQKIPEAIPAISSPWTRKYMADLMTKEVADRVKFVSALLSFPFSGIVSMKFELGWIGLLLYLASIWIHVVLLIHAGNRHEAKVRNWIWIWAVFWLLFPMIIFFDNYQEQPAIVYPLMILAAFFLNAKPTANYV